MNLPTAGKHRLSAASRPVGRGQMLLKPLPLARIVVRDALARTLAAIG